MPKEWGKQQQPQERCKTLQSITAGTHMSVLQESSHKWQRPWARNAQLLEGLVGPYPIAVNKEHERSIYTMKREDTSS